MSAERRNLGLLVLFYFFVIYLNIMLDYTGFQHPLNAHCDVILFSSYYKVPTSQLVKSEDLFHTVMQRIAVRQYTDPQSTDIGCFREVLDGAAMIRHDAVTLQSSPRPGDERCPLPCWFSSQRPAAWKHAARVAVDTGILMKFYAPTPVMHQLHNSIII